MKNFEQKLELHAKALRHNIKIDPMEFSNIRQNQAAPRRHHRFSPFAIAAALVLVLCIGTVSAAVLSGFNFIDWIMGAYSDRNATDIQEQLDNGEWVYLNGENIAVIIPESPTKILLSNDGGKKWTETTVDGTEKGFHFGEEREGFQYSGGYIGFADEKTGYLVLTTGVALGSQDARIFLTKDGGDHWTEIGNLNSIHPYVITGAGMSPSGLVFISYRYYIDVGPDIWYTANQGDSWERLEIDIPEQFAGDQYRFTPHSPTFDGLNGSYPISVIDSNATDESSETLIFMHSNDGGLTWRFED